MGGAIGLMTLAVMTRATLGHTGQVLTAGRGTTLLYLAIASAIFSRVGAGFWPAFSGLLLDLAAVGWALGFGGFVLVYGWLLLRHKKHLCH